MAAFTSSNTVLEADGEWTGPLRGADRQDAVIGYAFSDVAGTVYVEQSGDGTDWDLSDPFTVTAGEAVRFNVPLVTGAWRVRYVNDSDDQAEFRVYAKTGSAGDS